MVADIISKFFVPLIKQCAYWVGVIFKSVDGFPVYLAAILFVMIINFFLMPLRGTFNPAAGFLKYFTRRPRVSLSVRIPVRVNRSPSESSSSGSDSGGSDG